MRVRVPVIIATCLTLAVSVVALVGCGPSAGQQELLSVKPGTTVTSVKLLEIGNTLGVTQGAKAPKFSLPKAATITEILDYHYVVGGGPTPGTIGLRSTLGKVYGPWKCVGVDGQGGVKNATWDAKMNEQVPAGTYTIVDSGPETWSTNAKAKGFGFVTVMGYYTN